MSEGLKKLFYTLDIEEFKKAVEGIKCNPDTRFFFKGMDRQFFFLIDNEISEKLIKLYQLIWGFDMVLNQLSEYGKNKIIESFLVEEIKASNGIENINSDRNDIFYVLKGGKNSRDKKSESLTKAYSMLKEGKAAGIETIDDIRKSYDSLMEYCLNDDEKPDGRYFRKDAVSINDGISDIYRGFYPEERIIVGMEEFLNIYNDQNVNVMLRMILAHFILETVHPFYDGNGRLGRLLFSEGIYQGSKSNAAFVMAKIMEKRKSEYYHCFKEGRDTRQFGSLNRYVLLMCDLLINGLKEEMDNLTDKLVSVKLIQGNTKETGKVEAFMAEATVLSDFGCSVTELMEACNVSRRTVAYEISRLKRENKLVSVQIGKTVYNRLKENYITYKER